GAFSRADCGGGADVGARAVLGGGGAHDRTCPHEAAAKTAAALGTEQHTVPGAGHLPMAEAPEPTAALIASAWRRR
ncbi:alpha/beta fold hydrolase, partial [Nonomuraea sp. NPDC059007]|uniref:alpha/beta fold hydrolase n=1 Tax=Nonomuraea sp. NPDC059007 TaxID=3346692 RepID=UPI0036B0FCAE